jgi:hypothetical protein
VPKVYISHTHIEEYLMVILEGVAFPLDVINKNGWGIPSSDADNAISSLQKAVFRGGCSSDFPHERHRVSR